MNMFIRNLLISLFSGAWSASTSASTSAFASTPASDYFCISKNNKLNCGLANVSFIYRCPDCILVSGNSRMVDIIWSAANPQCYSKRWMF